MVFVFLQCTPAVWELATQWINLHKMCSTYVSVSLISLLWKVYMIMHVSALLSMQTKHGLLKARETKLKPKQNQQKSKTDNEEKTYKFMHVHFFSSSSLSVLFLPSNLKWFQGTFCSFHSKDQFFSFCYRRRLFTSFVLSWKHTQRETQHPTIFSWIFFPLAFIVWQQKLNAAHSLHWWYNRIQLLLPRNKRWAAFCIKCASQLWMQIFMIIEYLEMNILNAGWLQTNATIAAYWLTLARWSGKASIELLPFNVFEPIWAQGNVIQSTFLRIFHC